MDVKEETGCAAPLPSPSLAEEVYERDRRMARNLDRFLRFWTDGPTERGGFEPRTYRFPASRSDPDPCSIGLGVPQRPLAIGQEGSHKGHARGSAAYPRRVSSWPSVRKAPRSPRRSASLSRMRIDLARYRGSSSARCPANLLRASAAKRSRSSGETASAVTRAFMRGPFSRTLAGAVIVRCE